MNNFKISLLASCTLLLTACGGGSSSTDDTPPDQSGGTNTSWVKGTFAPASDFKGKCQTTLNQKNWLRSWSNETYLWYNEIPDTDPALTTGVVKYFDTLKTNKTTDSGAQKDNFHFSMSTEQWNKQNQSGVSLGYGFNMALLATAPPRRAVITYIEPNSPAALNGVERGMEVMQVDEVDFVNGSNVDTINAGLFPNTAGKQTKFVFKQRNSNQEVMITLTAGEITSTPVTNVKTLDTGAGKVGYFQFNSHIAPAERGLYDAIKQLEGQNISDLVIDLRYNGGGLLAMASQLGYMVAGKSNTQGVTFEKTIFNDKHPTTNPVTGQALTPMPFIDTYIGFDESSGIAANTPLPSLNLNRVYILTSGNTCSASEALINGLRGLPDSKNFEVVLIGSTTCGKPYGFYPTDNCDTTYFTIQFSGANNKGFGDYSDGFAPKNTQNGSYPVLVTGCAVADDFSHQLGDRNEGMLKAALDYRETGVCPAVSSINSLQGFAPQQVSDPRLKVEDKRIQTLLKNNRVMTPHFGGAQ